MLYVLTQMPLRPLARVPALQEYDAYQVGAGQGQGVSEAEVFGAGVFFEMSSVTGGPGCRAMAFALAAGLRATLVAA